MSEEKIITPEQEAQTDTAVKVHVAEGKKASSGAAQPASDQGMTRRRFLFSTGVVGAGALLIGQGVLAFALPNNVVAYPTSKGALLVDTKKCANCTSCMIACSSVHYGKASYELSRIQIMFNPFAPYPQGARQAQCHQCKDPKCVAACPTGANHVDTANGNVRTVDARKCIGCQKCIEACPFETARVQWDPTTKTSQKCDLCVTSKYWSEKGGPDGKHACEEVCPMRAIKYTTELPKVDGLEGYEVNLRSVDVDPKWAAYGLPTGDGGEWSADQLKAMQAAAGGATVSEG
ncbi:MAG: 4Fe-4S dicluster domain-containing protein [Coriobacteriia bacterium]|nr:4Fe-4S dicluster domain-containing protein [Coriobacteriia bacterium]